MSSNLSTLMPCCLEAGRFLQRTRSSCFAWLPQTQTQPEASQMLLTWLEDTSQLTGAGLATRLHEHFGCPTQALFPPINPVRFSMNNCDTSQITRACK